MPLGCDAPEVQLYDGVELLPVVPETPEVQPEPLDEVLPVPVGWETPEVPPEGDAPLPPLIADPGEVSPEGVLAVGRRHAGDAAGRLRRRGVRRRACGFAAAGRGWSCLRRRGAAGRRDARSRRAGRRRRRSVDDAAEEAVPVVVGTVGSVVGVVSDEPGAALLRSPISWPVAS